MTDHSDSRTLDGLHATVTAAAFAVVALAGTARGQVMINEVFENPDGSDSPLEFIELYGRPGMPLDGYAIGLFKGGQDGDSDDIPDSNAGDDTPEIDEAFALDGYALGGNGFLVLYNDTDNNSLIPGNVPAATAIVPWSDAHIPSTDTAGSLNDEGSSTYILMRARQNPDNVRKEILPDLDFDGVVDFGTETGPFYGGSSPEAVQPFQRVDELAWSNAGGKEYVSDSDRELSETPGFNPDFIARIEYYFDNPMLGHRTRPDGSGGFEILPTRTADESFVYGEVSMGVTADTSADFLGLAQTKGPTDQSATPYDGSCDPEPYDPGPNPACVPSAGGSFLFTDVDLTGWEVTPGDYNDGAGLFQIRLGVAQSGDDLPAGFSGRVWADGDLDFDGVVDGDDLSLAQQFLGATPGDTEPASDPQGEDTVRWVYQLSEFQALEMARHLDSADGPMGGNANAVTEADLDALTAMIALPGDTNGDGAVDLNDLLTVLSNFGDATAGGAADGDIDGNGEVDLNDLLTVLSNFGATTF